MTTYPPEFRCLRAHSCERGLIWLWGVHSNGKERGKEKGEKRETLCEGGLSPFAQIQCTTKPLLTVEGSFDLDEQSRLKVLQSSYSREPSLKPDTFLQTGKIPKAFAASRSTCPESQHHLRL